MEPASYSAEGVSRRGRGVILAVVSALAVIGYVVGLRAGVPEGSPGMTRVIRSESGPTREDEVIASLTYDEVGAGALRTRGRAQAWAEMVAALRAQAREPITDANARDASLQTRSERRAFNGAPPVIPHATFGLEDRSCLACHGEALQLGDHMARSLPHAQLTSCTQCHASTAPSFLASKGGALSGNAWRGIAAPRAGTRASVGAPPTVPHSLHMRENCLACHGPHGWEGMQTSHPERQSCLQCHAPTVDRAHPGRSLPGPRFLPPVKRVTR